MAPKCCQLRWVKVFFLFFITITLVIALGILGLGGYITYKQYHSFDILLGKLIFLPHYSLFLLGIGLILACILGYLSDFKDNDNHKLMNSFIILMTICFILQFLIACSSVLLSEPAKQYFGHKLLDTVQNYYFVTNNSMLDNELDRVQKNLRCCASYGVKDWQASGYIQSASPRRTHLNLQDSDSTVKFVPPSCCINFFVGCNYLIHPSNIYYEGCIDSIHKKTRDDLEIIYIVLFALCVFELSSIILACVYKQVQNDDDDYKYRK